MSNVQPLGPRKSMAAYERELLKSLAKDLPETRAGPAVMAELLRLIGSWMGHNSPLSFEAFAVKWLQQGNAQSKAAEKVLGEVFGIDGPGPRSAA